MKKLLYNFYGDLVFIICSLSCIPPRVSFDLWWIPCLGIFFSALFSLLTIYFIIKYKIFGVCELYNLASPFFSCAFILRFHFFDFYADIFPIINILSTILHFFYIIVGVARTIHYIKERKLDDVPQVKSIKKIT